MTLEQDASTRTHYDNPLCSNPHPIEKAILKTFNYIVYRGVMS